MAFTFENYGTFTGPGTPFEYRNNDDFDVSGYTEDVFNLSDVSMVLVNRSESPADYVYLHLNGTSTSQVTLERSSGAIPSFFVKANTTEFTGQVRADDFRESGGKTLSSRKSFDISHPNKVGWRLRHTCLEGPENAVYYRGRLTGKNFIELPEYWKGFVDPESITVSLTQIGCSQDLIVDKIEWGSRIIIKSGTSTNIDCYYLIHGTRMDGENLIVEYEGQTPADYPGDADQYSVAGWDYDLRGGK